MNIQEQIKQQGNISVGKGQNYLLVGDNSVWLKKIPDNSIDSIVTDPPAGISFMARGWDSDKGGRDHWIKWMQEVATECKRVLKPGGHAFVWAIPRTSHWTATAWENAGFEIRDVVAHIFGSGFPKSHNVEKALQKIQPERSSEFKGIGTALKPAREDWILMRKPLDKGLTIAENCLKWGTGGINIDESRVDYQSESDKASATPQGKCTSNASAGSAPDVDMSEVDYHGEKYWYKNEYKWLIDKWLNDEDYVWSELKENLETYDWCKVPEIDYGDRVLFDSAEGVCIRLYESKRKEFDRPEQLGRFPANLILSADEDGQVSEEVRECFPETGKGNGKGAYNYAGREYNNKDTSMFNGDKPQAPSNFNDSGNASRFFKSIIYQAKSSKSDRNSNGAVKNIHPTCKPTKLMEYLIKMVTPKGGVVLDPFAGSRTTGVACQNTGHNYILIEKEPEYVKICNDRLTKTIKVL